MTLSPDGARLAWLESHGGALNLTVAPVEDLDQSEQVTAEAGPSLLPVIIWAHTSNHLIVFRDQEGDENYRAFSVDVRTRAEIALTPGGGARALYSRGSRRFPTDVVLAVNARDRRVFDFLRVDVTTGVSQSIFVNEGFHRVHVDADLVVRFAELVHGDGSAAILERQPNGAWRPLLDIPEVDALTARLHGLSDDSQSVFILDSRGRDKVALFDFDLATRSATLVAEDPDADITDVVYHPATGRPVAAAATTARKRWHVIDPSFNADLGTLLADAGEADLAIHDGSADTDRWLVFLDRPDAAGEFRLYERRRRSTRRLFEDRLDLADVSLRPMRAVTIEARDGLRLPGYLTLPEEHLRAGPMILTVHGGPYDRDVWGYSPTHQWLSACGYAALSVNFRGSTGFGKAFVNAADREWGGRMQDDLLDAAAWAVQQGYADPARIGIFGASYGGYAALMAATRTPQTFACFVAVSAPSNLITFIEGIPPYWGTWFAAIKRRLADPATDTGRAWLIDRSPLTHVDRIACPMLLAQGLNDVRVSPRESEQIVQALQARRVPVTCVTFKDEGHFFVRQENRIAFAAVMEAFLARHLGGASAPLGDAFAGSSIRIETGADLVERTPDVRSR